MSVGKRIAAKRKEKKLTQASLAEAVGVSTPFISQIEGDNRKPSYGLVLKIAHILDAPVDSLLVESAGELDDPSDRLFYSMARALEPEKKKRVIDYIALITGCKIFKEFPFFSTPTEYAQFIIHHYKVKTLPVDVRQIAKNLGVELLYTQTGDSEGILHKTVENPIILLDSEATYPERETFTIAILLGHLIIPWHLKSTFYRRKHIKSLDHESRIDIEARQFAGELMLPGQSIKKDLKGFTASIDLFHKLASERYCCSMTAVAHKYIEYFGSKTVYITSSKNAITRAYTAGFPYKLVTTVKEGSIAFSLTANPPTEKETRKGVVNGAVWLEDAPPGLAVVEESMIDPKFNVTVTLLHIASKALCHTE
ncbi:hypothetical protein GMST_14200 [Geomonas silvestris]|uniref:HTH cro/C1-type domain-containing protein n=1 Tax=Geomonas silvestris TaxID=2740184 RepID=A0A6V8MGK6_9BACT|nr:XRE family transcriptional regulator [Geomonas silvestris]GFO59095.1 hypothetical protein GMST_14200 [Geomonas silvestris]